jgi:hypothetical protein
MTAQLQAPPIRATARNGIGYTALALGILALITSPLLVGLLFGSLSITLGLASLDDDEATNRKSTIAAVVLGVIASVIGIVALVVRIWFLVCRFG